MIRELSALAFALYDLQLFLDTHPNDVNAITLYNQYRQKYLALVAEYERRYGPLTALNGAADNQWKWIRSPWPWEYGANMEV